MINEEQTNSQKADEFWAARDEAQQDKELAAQQEAQQVQQEEQMAKDPHGAKDPKEFGVKENVKEGFNAVLGAGVDTVDDLLSAPQNLWNLATGGDYYSALDHMAGVDTEDRLNGLVENKWRPTTKTVWGNIARGVGSFIIPGKALTSIGIAARLGKGLGKVGAIQKAAQAVKVGQGFGKANAIQMVGRGGVKGLTIAAYNGELIQKANLANAEFVKANPFFDTVLGPLAIDDADSPLVTRLKNVSFELGFGSVFDVVSYGIGARLAKKGLKGKPDQYQVAASSADQTRTQMEFDADAKAKINLERQLKKEVAAKYRMENNGKTLSSLSKKNQLAEMILFAEGNPRYKDWSPDEDALTRNMRKANDAEKSVNDQRVELGTEELQSPEFGANKNYQMTDTGQGDYAPSTASPYQVARQLNRVEEDLMAAGGSVENFQTQRAIANMASGADMHEKEVVKVIDNLIGDARRNELVKNLRTYKDVSRHFEPQLRRMANVINRDGVDDPLKYWEDFFNNQTAYKPDSPEAKAWMTENLEVADLIIGSNLKRMNDLAIAAREIKDKVDITKIDSLYTRLRQRIKIGLLETKKARYMASINLSNLKKGQNSDLLKAKLDEFSTDIDRTLAFLDGQIAQGKSNAWLDGILEMLSMPDLKMYNVEDVMEFARRKVKGYDGNTGLAIKEAQNVFTNSILSGPKTPIRAISGTGLASFLRPMTTALGAGMTMDFRTAKSALMEVGGMVGAIPEATNYFFKQLNSYWSGDVATTATRFADKTKEDANWKFLGEMMEGPNATESDKAAYRIANIARNLNSNSWLTWSPKVMAAGDDAFRLIMARGRAKATAGKKAAQLNPGVEVTPKMLRDVEDETTKLLMDDNGILKDEFFSFNLNEAKLTQDLTGFSEKLANLFNSNPWTKPFFMFARTGINGLELTAKHTPLMNLMVKQQRAIMMATPDKLGDAVKYGIRNADDLAAAKAGIVGRQALGSSIVFMAAQKFMNGELRGDGPADRQRRKAWRDLGGDQYSPRQIKIGDTWVGFDSFEPFGPVLTTIANIGDYSQEMGEEWTKDQFQKISMILAESATSKSYLAGLQQLVDLLSGEPQGFSRTIAGLLNNQVPMSSLRNELGKVINPFMKEVGNDIFDQIRLRNMSSELLSADPIEIKYDMISGKPIADYDFPTRMFNMFSPVSLNLEMTPGRDFLFRSGYDTSLAVMYTPDQVDLTRSPRLRSMFQRALGNQGLEAKLSRLAKDPKMLASLAQMEKDREGPRRTLDPMKYPHTERLNKVMEDARKNAWAEVRKDPEAQELLAIETKRKAAELNMSRGNFSKGERAAQELLNLKNK